MGMKRADSPRRLYVIGGRLVALLGGKVFVAPADSHFTATSLVILESLPSDGGRARVTVKAPRGTVTETWRSVKRESLARRRAA